MDASKLTLTGLVLIICSLIFQLIGLASPYWISFEYLGIKVHSGLWKTCATVKLTDKVKCIDFESAFDWFKAVRATSIMGFISLLVALVMAILKMFFMKDKKPTFLAAIGTAFIGALFILISIAVYSSKVDDLTTSQITYDYHFAFVFCIMAMLAAVGAGAVMVVDAVRTKSI